MSDLTIINEEALEAVDSTMFYDLYQKTLTFLEKSENYQTSLIFLSDEEIQKINKEYRFKDEATDVISFALHDDLDDGFQANDELGDIFISIDTAMQQAKTLEHSLEDELRFLFVHGLLHLLGYDHQNLDEEKEMFDLQRMILDGDTKKDC